MTRRPLPCNDAAEAAVIGGCLFGNAKAFFEVDPPLEAADFYDQAHEAIWAAMRALSDKQQGIDIITVAEEMRRAGTMPKLLARGSEGYLAELATAVATYHNINDHAALIRDTASVRRVLLAASEVVEKGYSASDAASYTEAAEQCIYEAARQRSQAGASTLASALHLATEDLQRRYKAGGKLLGAATGFKAFDRMTSGLQPGQLVVFGGRPAMGKTAFAMNVGENMAEMGGPVLVFSYEMSKSELALRMAASRGSVELSKLRDANLNDDDWKRLWTASAELSRLPVLIEDNQPTLASLRSQARRWRADRQRFPTADTRGLIIVDYLQIMPSTGLRERNREQEVSEISRGLKNLAKELQVPVIALSQLNRDVENRTDKRPQMADLRESGAIEQDADVIAMLYRDGYYKKDPTDHVAECNIVKQRNGPTGMVPLYFDAHFTRFHTLEEHREES